MSEGVRGIVVAHGAMAAGLISAVRRIVGDPAEALTAVSNEGCDPDALRARVEEAAGSGDAVIFADLHAGSCGMAAFSSCRNAPGRIVVSGVNLPMLLDFSLNRDLALPALAERLREKGRTSIRVFDPSGVVPSPPSGPRG